MLLYYVVNFIIGDFEILIEVEDLLIKYEVNIIVFDLYNRIFFYYVFVKMCGRWVVCRLGYFFLCYVEIRMFLKGLGKNVVSIVKCF